MPDRPERGAARVALIRGDGIGVDVAEAAIAVADAALRGRGLAPLTIEPIEAGAAHFGRTGQDIEPGGEERAAEADAIFLGAIGLPDIRHPDGTEISPHLRLRDRLGLYGGVRPARAYANVPRRLADPRAEAIDLVIVRESTEGLFWSAAVHGRSDVREENGRVSEVRDTLRITRATTERLHRFAHRLAARRAGAGRNGRLTCVDKANVFTSMAFFRSVFDEVHAAHPEVRADHAYVDAAALELVRRPWDYGVLVTENMFGDILSDLAGGLVGGMGMAPCAEIGDDHALFQPAHGSAPDIAGQDAANPLAAILSGAMMLDWLGERAGREGWAEAGRAIEVAVERLFAADALRPREFGGTMGTVEVARRVIAAVGEGRA